MRERASERARDTHTHAFAFTRARTHTHLGGLPVGRVGPGEALVVAEVVAPGAAEGRDVHSVGVHVLEARPAGGNIYTHYARVWKVCPPRRRARDRPLIGSRWW